MNTERMGCGYMQLTLGKNETWDDVLDKEIAKARAYSYNGVSIPHYTASSLVNWAYLGAVKRGGFMGAIQQNDLAKAIEYADGKNLKALKTIMMWIWNVAPSDMRDTGFEGMIRQMKYKQESDNFEDILKREGGEWDKIDEKFGFRRYVRMDKEHEDYDDDYWVCPECSSTDTEVDSFEAKCASCGHCKP